ncbi:hypothetical protein EGS33_17090 [Acinetobacter sp. FDAARGOS_541]|nr:hypothetical protein EGS33_17090 [Acinetobacter sp. FDAARGOS_541]
MVRGIANSKIGFGDLILLLRYFFKLKVSTHPNYGEAKRYILLLFKDSISLDQQYIECFNYYGVLSRS